MDLLVIVAAIFFILWVLGIVGAATIPLIAGAGYWVHILLVIAIVLIVLKVID